MSRLAAALRSTPVRLGFLVVALVAAVWAVASQWEEVRAAVTAMGPAAAAGALAAGCGYVLLTMLAWRSLLAGAGTRLPLRTAFSVFFVSQLGKYLPGGVWNVLAAAEMGADHAIPRRRSVSVMVVTVVVSTVTGLALAAGTMPFAPPQVARTYGLSVLALPVLVVVLLPPVLNRILGLALRATGRPPLEAPLGWRAVGACAAWTLAAWVVAGLQVWVLAVGTGMAASASALVLCVGGYALAWTVGFLVVVVPAGAGVREAVLGLVLAGTLSSGGVVAVVLASRLALTVADLLAGAVGIALVRRRPVRGGSGGR